jgi:acyl-CoA dehydrogenase
MDFKLNEEQILLVETTRKVGERFGLEYWKELDAKKEFGSTFWQAVCDAGLCGVAVPEAFGGSGLGMQEMALIIENLAASGGGGDYWTIVHE